MVPCLFDEKPDCLGELLACQHFIYPFLGEGKTPAGFAARRPRQVRPEHLPFYCRRHHVSKHLVEDVGVDDAGNPKSRLKSDRV